MAESVSPVSPTSSLSDSAAGGGDAEPLLVRVRDLRKSFGPTRAVDGISFSASRGEILGFLGPNGAGKSTTLKIITGYLAPDSGTAVVAGHDVDREPLESRRAIGYLPESLPLYWEMRVDEYLRFIGESRSLRGGALARRIDEVVGRLGLERMRKRLTGSLSKGYRQRVGLAQAILHDPQVLILDEPTNGLDPQQIIEIRELIRDLARTKAVIFSTHILQEIQAICHRIMVIRDGRLIADDTPERLAEQLGTPAWEAVVGGVDELHPETLAALGLGSLVDRERHANGWLYRFSGPGKDLPTVAEVASRLGERGARLLEISRPRRSLEQVYLELTGAARGPGKNKGSA